MSITFGNEIINVQLTELLNYKSDDYRRNIKNNFILL